MKKLILTLALLAVLSPLSAQACPEGSCAMSTKVYKTFDEAWASCIDGTVSATYDYISGNWVLVGYTCRPHSGGGN